MTTLGSTYPYALGGLNGNNWGAYSQVYGGAAQAGNNAFNGASAADQAAAARARHNTIDNAGIRAGEIVGWRAWKLYPDGYLRSMAVSKIWMPGQPMKGDVISGAGVHAFKEKAQALEQYSLYSSEAPVVIGKVALWGEVVEHQTGYRAEYGEIDSLDTVVIYETEIGVMAWRRRRQKQREALAALSEMYCAPRGVEERGASDQGT